jgi:hypothetical protein
VRAAYQERDYDEVGQGGDPGQTLDRRIVVNECGEHLSRHPPPAQRLGQVERGCAALRVAPGTVAYEPHRHFVTVQAALSHELGDPPCDQRSHARMSSHGRSLPQPQLGETSIERQLPGQDDVAVMTRAGEERHDGDFVRLDLVQHGVIARLALVESHRHFIVETPLP